MKIDIDMMFGGIIYYSYSKELQTRIGYCLGRYGMSVSLGLHKQSCPAAGAHQNKNLQSTLGPLIITYPILGIPY